jgi:general secretion pathway protein C
VNNAEPILSRNPFDSVTGPLNAQQLEMSEVQTARVDASNPLQAPGCDGVRVSIITESTDPTWSIAALQGPGEPGPKIRGWATSRRQRGRCIGLIGRAALGVADEQRPCQALLPRKPGGRTRTSGPWARRTFAGHRFEDPKVSRVQRRSPGRRQDPKTRRLMLGAHRSGAEDGKVVGIRLFGIGPTRCSARAFSERRRLG